MPTVWKIAPGDNACMWPECEEDGITTINWHWLRPRNFAKFESVQAIRDAFRDLGDTSTARGSGPKSIFNFIASVRPGHVVVANRGLSRVAGIGIVTSEYLPPAHRDNPRRRETYHCHVRKVDWKIKNPVDLGSKLFRQDTLTKLEPAEW